MPRKIGKCLDCGIETSKNTTLRCQRCNNKSRKGNWPPKKKLQVKKCFLCGNLNNLNQNQQRIWQLKEQIAIYKQLHDFHLKQLNIVRDLHEETDKKVQRTVAYKNKVSSETFKRLQELKNIAISLDQRISK